MNNTSSMLLMGVGTAGCRMARGISRVFEGDIRRLLIDTDAVSGQENDDFVLLGGDRLSGRGTGGDLVAARMAAEETIGKLNDRLEGVRLAVMVTALGGGTGGGATLEAVKHLASLGIPTLVFATTPFCFEGEDRQRNTRGIMNMIEEAANATFFLPLDKLVADEDNFENALKRAVDTVAAGVTMFWRLVEKPGYLRLDAERIRHLLSNAGRGRFAMVTTQGSDRATDAVDRLIRSELLATASTPVRACLCGVLAGEDLRLSELGRIADGIRGAFGEHLAFELGTVNDEYTFCGRIAVVVMLFEGSEATASMPSNAAGGETAPTGGRRGGKRGHANAGGNANFGGRFSKAEPTVRHGEDLDLPTYLRRAIMLDF